MLTTILATIVVLGVLIFIHELGHFVTAKMVDIEVPRFSIGLGPKMVGFRRGETEYVISWLPLGGYVKMAGMEEMEAIEGGPAERVHVGDEAGDQDRATGVAGASDLGLVQEERTGEARRSRDFESKSLAARTLVISAGVLMNFLFAVVIFAGSALVWGVEVEPEARLPELSVAELPAGAEALAAVPAGTRVIAVDNREIEDFGDFQTALLTAGRGPVTLSFEQAAPVTIDMPANDTARAMLIGMLGPVHPAVIGDVMEGRPAAEAGLQPGDRVLAVNGEPVDHWGALVKVIRAHPGQRMDLTVERDGQSLAIPVVPASQTIELPDGESEVIGQIGAAVYIEHEEPGLLGAIAYGFTRTGEIIALIVNSLVDLVTGDVSPRSLGGPILIGQISGEVARAGLQAFLNFMALFSVNLAVLNLLPIPVLDGGHLMFLAIEAVRGKALSFEQRMRFTQVGFVLVVALMVWAIANDFLRLFGL
mgnify:FL=1